jgi:hypothetical protein
MEKNNYIFEKNNSDDVIWWVEDIDCIGKMMFTFDKKKIFNIFEDYPHNLTEEQKHIFDKENPYWAEFLKDRS